MKKSFITSGPDTSNYTSLALKLYIKNNMKHFVRFHVDTVEGGVRL